MIESRRLATALTVLYVVLVAFIVFLPTEAVATGSVIHIWRFLHALGAPGFVTPDVVEFATNVVMFMPLSLLGSTFKPRWGWWRWLLTGMGISCFIELTQLVFLSARSAQVADVVSNTLGAVLGYGLVVLARRGRRVLSASAEQQRS